VLTATTHNHFNAALEILKENKSPLSILDDLEKCQKRMVALKKKITSKETGESMTVQDYLLVLTEHMQRLVVSKDELEVSTGLREVIESIKEVLKILDGAI
jgi:hypothetical protein